MAKLQNPKKADLNKDGKINSYEEKRAKAIEKSMAAQNRVKEKWWFHSQRLWICYGSEKKSNYNKLGV